MAMPSLCCCYTVLCALKRVYEAGIFISLWVKCKWSTTHTAVIVFNDDDDSEKHQGVVFSFINHSKNIRHLVWVLHYISVYFVYGIVCVCVSNVSVWPQTSIVIYTLTDAGAKGDDDDDDVRPGLNSFFTLMWKPTIRPPSMSHLLVFVLLFLFSSST